MTKQAIFTKYITEQWAPATDVDDATDFIDVISLQQRLQDLGLYPNPGDLMELLDLLNFKRHHLGGDLVFLAKTAHSVK